MKYTGAPMRRYRAVLDWLARQIMAGGRRALARMLLVALAVPIVAVAAPAPAARAYTPVYFAATGHNLGAHFKTFWEQNGGLVAFGYPLSEEFVERGRPVQYFERAVFNYFAEYANTPYEVQLAQIGRAALAGRSNEAAMLPVAPFVSTGDGYFFPETGHALRFAFLRHWQAGGGLAIYGYPLTEEFVEVSAEDVKPYTVQYFERARFEYRPDQRGAPAEVGLGLLGYQFVRAHGLHATLPFQPVDAPPRAARVITRGNPIRPAVALTFDAGADRGNTTAILDTLAANNIRATFGLTGEWARANPDLVRRIAAEGHLIVNHTDDHRSWTGRSDRGQGLSADARVAGLDGADAAVLRLTGRSTRPWFRSPYGDVDDAALVQLAASGYTYNVLWTVDSLGWQGLGAAAIVNRVAAAAVPGAIVLMHVGASSADAEALQPLIGLLRGRGMSFLTVEQIIAP